MSIPDGNTSRENTLIGGIDIPGRRRPARPVRQIVAPLSIALFVLLTFAGTYYIRKGLLERAMRLSMEIQDTSAMRRLARVWWSPVRVRDGARRTPLHLAAWVDDNALAVALVDAGADPNARDVNGNTPLHYARSVAVAAPMIAHGGRLTEMNAAGQTPLHYAASTFRARDETWSAPRPPERVSPFRPPDVERPWGSPELIEFLASKGANVNWPDKWLRTPLRAAKRARRWAEVSDSDDPGRLAAWDRIVATLEKLGAGE